MQTSIEWFFNELQRMQYFIGNDMLEAYNQAKEMHKAEILDAYMARMDITDKEYFKQIIGMEYYNETFKKD